MSDFFRKYPILSATGVVCLLILLALGTFLTWRAIDRAQSRALEERLTKLETDVAAMADRVRSAQKEHESSAPDFWPKYAEAVELDLEEARENFEEEGRAFQTLKEARNLQGKGRKYRDEANHRVEEVEDMLVQAQGITDKILGTESAAGYYEALRAKAKTVDEGLLDAIAKEVGDARDYLDGMPRKSLCGSEKTLSYSRAYARLTEAEEALRATRAMENDLWQGMPDKPAIFDAVQVTLDIVREAKDVAHKDGADLDRLETAIKDTSVEIAVAQNYIDTGHYWGRPFAQRDAQTVLDGAKNTLESAKDCCYAEDFDDGFRRITEVKRQISRAKEIAATPTPTPTDTPTPTYTPTPTWTPIPSDTPESTPTPWVMEEEEDTPVPYIEEEAEDTPEPYIEPEQEDTPEPDVSED